MILLPINLDDLINPRMVESVRREYKRTWSEPVLEQVTRTICAFANDFYNLNGGYIIIGIDESDGLPILPPHGLENSNIDEIQKKIRTQCKRIDPEYQPLLVPTIYQDKHILIIWAPGGDNRPYQAPESRSSGERFYYIRIGNETTKAQGNILNQLLEMTAKVPFDDRRNLTATIDSISPTLVRNYLADIKSNLVIPGVSIPDRELYRYLRISVPANGFDVPKNVGLLFFNNDPEQYFSGARIEIVQFGDDAGGNLIEEKKLRGPLHHQIRQALDYLYSFSTTMIRKVDDQAEAIHTVAFPYEAMEEALVNAVYHRSYEYPPEPVKVYLYPDRIEIISYPGPVPGIELKHLEPGYQIPPVPNRNRRIGEFLKELRLAEGRGTGIPKIRRKMNENGSPDPIFEFNESRSYFRVILPAHPQYVVIQSIRESAYLWASGERKAAIGILDTALQRIPNSGKLIAQLINYYAELNDLSRARELFRIAESNEDMSDRQQPYISMAKALLDRDNIPEAQEILNQTPSPIDIDELVELALLHKRSDRLQQAHRLFSDNFDLIKDNPKAVHEYAQTKMKLAGKNSGETRQRLNREAAELLRRAIQLSDSSIRSAWCWYNLAQVLGYMMSPSSEIDQAYQKAIQLIPSERRFSDAYEKWKRRSN